MANGINRLVPAVYDIVFTAAREYAIKPYGVEASILTHWIIDPLLITLLLRLKAPVIMVDPSTLRKSAITLPESVMVLLALKVAILLAVLAVVEVIRLVKSKVESASTRPAVLVK